MPINHHNLWQREWGEAFSIESHTSDPHLGQHGQSKPAVKQVTVTCDFFDGTRQKVTTFSKRAYVRDENGQVCARTPCTQDLRRTLAHKRPRTRGPVALRRAPPSAVDAQAVAETAVDAQAVVETAVDALHAVAGPPADARTDIAEILVSCAATPILGGSQRSASTTPPERPKRKLHWSPSDELVEIRTYVKEPSVSERLLEMARERGVDGDAERCVAAILRAQQRRFPYPPHHLVSGPGSGELFDESLRQVYEDRLACENADAEDCDAL